MVQRDICDSENLNCNWNKNLLVRYLIFFSPYMIISTISLILLRIWTGRSSFIITYSIFLPIFFILFRPLVQCSHCPYYKEKKFMEPIPKIWKFNFRSMTNFEKISYLIGLSFFQIFPLSAQIVGIISLINRSDNANQWNIVIFSLVMFLTLVLNLSFILNLSTKLCIRCIHFSCPMNRVKQEIKNKFIESNPDFENIKFS
jgi:hypothetical protein